MKEFYLVPRKIAEHYATQPNIDADKQISETNPQSEKEDKEKNIQQPPNPSLEHHNSLIDKQLTTSLLPGSFSKRRRNKSKMLVGRMKDGALVKGGRKKRKKAILFQRKRGQYQHKVESNPPLDAIINRQIPEEKKREYVKSLLHYFKNNPNIIWDKNGNLMRPFSGYNIIDIIKDISVTNSLRQANDFTLAIYKMLIDYTDLPLQVVKNKKIAESVYGGGGGGGGKKKCSKLALDKWVCYD